MELTQEKIEELKKQIIENIENTFPQDKKEYAMEKVRSMGTEEFLEFLKKNNILEKEDGKESSGTNPFRLIIEGKIPYYLIDENKEALAVLEIRPISKGHAIIIPKKPVNKSEKIPKTIIALAKKISERIKAKFKPKEVLISSSYLFEEIIINILPVYSNESIESPRKQISPEELEELRKALEKKPLVKKEPKLKIKNIDPQKMWLPKRIP